MLYTNEKGGHEKRQTNSHRIRFNDVKCSGFE